MAKAKFKIGTLIKFGEGTFGEITGVIHRTDGVVYEAQVGANSDTVREPDVAQAYTPKKATVAKTKTTTARPRKTKHAVETQTATQQ